MLGPRPSKQWSSDFWVIAKHQSPPPETAQELLVHGLGWKIAGELHSFSSPFASDCLEPKDPRYLIIAITAKS